MKSGVRTHDTSGAGLLPGWRNRGRVAAGFAGVSVLWGSEWMLSSWLNQQPSLAGTAWHWGIAAVLLLPFLIREQARLRRWRWWRANLSAAMALMAAPQLLLLWEPVHAPAGMSMVIFAAVPLLTLFFVRDGMRWLGPALLGLGGMMLLAFDPGVVRARNTVTMLLILGAASSLAWGMAYASKVLKGAPVGASVCVQMGVSAGVLALASLLRERGPAYAGGGWADVLSMRGPGVAAWAALAVEALGSALGYVLLLWLLQRVLPVQAGALQWAATLITVVESGAMTGSRPDWQMTAGALTVVGSLLWVMWGRSGGNEMVTLW